MLLAEASASAGSINGEDSTSTSNEEVGTSPLMMFGEEEKNSSDKNKTSSSQEAEGRRQTEQNDIAGENSSSQIERGNLSTGIAEEEGDEVVIRLDHFRQAIEDYPTAARLIILEREGNFLIKSQEADPDTAGANQGENRNILRTGSVRSFVFRVGFFSVF